MSYDYTVRLIAVRDGEPHTCEGRIVSVIQGTYNPDQASWYITALVERPTPEKEQQ